MAEQKLSAAFKTLIAEAANQDENGMYHVASVMANRAKRRGTDMDTEATRPFQFTGYMRKDLDQFVAKQPKQVHEQAYRAMQRALTQPASTATHYVTTGLYKSKKRPSWVGKMKVVGTVGDHIFLQE